MKTGDCSRAIQLKGRRFLADASKISYQKFGLGISSLQKFRESSMAAVSSSIVSESRKDIPSIETTRDIPTYCTHLAKLLDGQPCFSGYGSLRNKCKVVPLESPVI